MPKPSDILQAPTDWRCNLRSFSLQVGFRILLTKAMLEFLCAVSDDVCWDRALFWKEGVSENWIASAASLIKRGLIGFKSQDEIENRPKWKTWDESCQFTQYKLTPAGEAVVSLVKMAGVFVEADSAINKKARKRA